MGGAEPGTPVPGESPLEYHPRRSGILTPRRDPGGGPCQVGSLTGAVASQRVTEARKGRLGLDGNQFLECNGISLLDCKVDKPSRDESRS